MANISVKHLTKIYPNGHQGLKAVSLEIYAGELFVILGPSGSGKTTLLRIIAGLERATSGDVYIDGKNMNGVAPKDRGVSMVFQNYALFPYMTVFDNIAFPLQMKKIRNEKILNQVDYVSKLLHIDMLLKRKPSELSGGQRQRAAIGRAIVMNPKIFLMDEPLSNLDVLLRRKMREEIKELQQKIDSTIIYVTHDQNEAKILGDRVCLLNEGTIQQIGPFKELCQNPTNDFVATFIDSEKYI